MTGRTRLHRHTRHDSESIWLLWFCNISNLSVQTFVCRATDWPRTLFAPLVYRGYLIHHRSDVNLLIINFRWTQTPRCMARILVTKNPIKWWQNLPGAVKRSHEVFGMDGEDGFITSLYRRESRRPQQGSLGHIIQWWFKTDEIVLWIVTECHGTLTYMRF